jgi:hypothetical protein
MQKGRQEAFSGGVCERRCLPDAGTRPDPVAVTLNNGRKKALYQLSIAAIFVHIAVSIGCYVVVATAWAVPAKKLERSIEK